MLLSLANFDVLKVLMELFVRRFVRFILDESIHPFSPDPSSGVPHKPLSW
ncbi:hypothetical protein N0Y54_00295 [Nostoc punctiforme UO1]